MVKYNSNIILVVIIGLAIIVSGCTSGQDVTSVFKALPEVQQFMNEHPNAKITVTYWSKEEVTQSVQEISQKCDKSITPVAMYKATISEGDLKVISWINAENQIVVCSTTEGKQTTQIPIVTATPNQTITATPEITVTAQVVTAAAISTLTPTPTPIIITPTTTQTPKLYDLMQNYALSLCESGSQKNIRIQLVYDGLVAKDDIVVAEGNDFSLYDGNVEVNGLKVKTYILNATFNTFFTGTSGFAVSLSNLVQYDRYPNNVNNILQIYSGKIILEKNNVNIVMPNDTPCFKR